MLPSQTPYVTEQDVINAVSALEHAINPLVELGIGDDCAVLRPSEAPGIRQLVTTDLLVEGVHFDLRYMKLEDVGWKALAVSISDVAAMGGVSRLALGQLGVPPCTAPEQLSELLAGVQRCAIEFGVQLIGGDTVAAPQWTIGFTVLGECDGPPVRRSGAQPGDRLWHCGLLGLSQVGFHLLWGKAQGVEELGRTPYYRKARDQHRLPQPKAELGGRLHELMATAAIDTSDSLAKSVLQLARASGVGVRLDFSEYPFAPQVTAFATGCRKQAGLSTDSGGFTVPAEYSPGNAALEYATLTEFLLASSEDYALLFTAPPEMEIAWSPGSLGLVQLGEITAAGSGERCLDETGREFELTDRGWRHL